MALKRILCNSNIIRLNLSMMFGAQFLRLESLSLYSIHFLSGVQVTVTILVITLAITLHAVALQTEKIETTKPPLYFTKFGQLRSSAHKQLISHGSFTQITPTVCSFYIFHCQGVHTEVIECRSTKFCFIFDKQMSCRTQMVLKGGAVSAKM